MTSLAFVRGHMLPLLIAFVSVLGAVLLVHCGDNVHSRSATAQADSPPLLHRPTLPSSTAGQNVSVESEAAHAPVEAKHVRMTGSLDFGEGLSAQVNFVDARPEAPLSLGGDSLASRFDVLWSLSKAGDGLAGRSLYDFLASCEGLLGAEPSMDAALVALDRDSLVPTASGLRPIEPADYESWRRTLVDGYRFCEGAEGILERVTPSERRSLVESAAQSDVLAARRLLSDFEYPRAERLELLQELWRAGYVEFLDDISRAYENEREFSGDDSGQELFLLEYAYLRAYSEIIQSAYSSADSAQYAGRLQELRALVAAKAAAFGPEAQKQADALAHELVVSNPECCKGIFPIE